MVEWVNFDGSFLRNCGGSLERDIDKNKKKGKRNKEKNRMKN